MMSALFAFAIGEPNTCQPRAAHPFLPIYHIIGNVTTGPDGAMTSLEDINDVSSVILYKGVYHVFHQCCQNHWDHLVSKDLMHWTRLPPPIVPNMNPTGVPHPDWYDSHGSWDGSLSLPHDWNGLSEPVVVMTAVEDSHYKVGMAVVRPTNASDPFLLSWTKDAANPINFTSGALTTPYDTPGQLWKNGDHWNFLILGTRYTTTDPSFHTWGVAPGDKFAKFGETGGQWFSPIANLADGSAPPEGSPRWMMNVGAGNTYALGEYHRDNETWTTIKAAAIIDHGPDAAWMAGQFAGERFMNIGWMKHGPPMVEDTVAAERSSAARDEAREGMRHADGNAESEVTYAYTQPPASGTNCSFTSSWQVFDQYTNIYDREPSPTNVTHGTLKFIGLFDTADACFAAVNKSTDGPFHSFTYNDDTCPQPYGRHCWADTSFTWQGRGGAKGQVSGRGPGFPVHPQIPSRYTNHHLTGLREVAYDPRIASLVSNPVKELLGLRNGTLASETNVRVTPSAPHIVAGTGAPHDASTSDVVVRMLVPTDGGAPSAVGVRALANVTDDGLPFGGILTVVNFTARDANGTMHATASIRTLDPCGRGSSGLSTASFSILKGESAIDLRLLVDRSVVEVFVMGGRVVFSATYAPSVLYVPDTHIALHAWGSTTGGVTATSIEVYSMGCGWTDPPYQTNPR